MIIETNTNYAYKLKYMDNPSFDKVRDLSTRFYRELPQALQDELYEALNRGIDILDSEPQMTAYLYAFGKMHQAKLQYAFDKLPDEFLSQTEIEILDYGCGQAIGTMCYADFLRTNGYSQKVKSITLIEPSEICLKRAALHASVFFPDAEIKTVNKTFDDLLEDDIVCRKETPTLHILSNVLDMTCFNLDKFSGLIKDCLKGYNQFVCVGPYFGSSDKTKRMEDFCSLLEGEQGYYNTFEQNELVEDKTWTAQILCFSVGKLEVRLSTEVTNKEVKNGIIDKFGIIYSSDGTKLLKWHCGFYPHTYTIKKGTKVICDQAFWGCESLQQITIPNSVISIGHSAFANCESLQQIIIPDSVISIGEGAFWGCESLQQITIPNSVICIGDGAFSCWHNFIIKSFSSRFLVQNKMLIDNKENRLISYVGDAKSLKIPNKVKCIGSFAFADCKSLQQIIIPNSVTSIRVGVFWGCESLLQIIIPDPVLDSAIDDIEYEFEKCESLQQIIIPIGTKEKYKQLFPKDIADKLVEI